MRFHHLNAEVANVAQSQAGQLRNCVCHLPKNIFDRIEAACSRTRFGVADAEGLKQVAQDFPIISRLAGRANGAIQSLETTIAVNHRATLLRESIGRKDDCGQFSRGVRQNIHYDECRETRELFGCDPECDRIFAERNEGLHAAGIHRLDDGRQIRAGFGNNPEQARAVGVRIAIFAQQDVVARAGTWDDVDPFNAKCSGKLRGQPEFGESLFPTRMRGSSRRLSDSK